MVQTPDVLKPFLWTFTMTHFEFIAYPHDKQHIPQNQV